jgi:hypothetical protein
MLAMPRRSTGLVSLIVLFSVCGSRSTAQAGEVEAALSHWEQTSQSRVPPALDDLEPRYGAIHSGHELTTAIGLLGPVRVDRLYEDFEWTTCECVEGEPGLVGRPRDEIDRLFFASVEVLLDDAGAVSSLRFHDRDGTVRPESIRWASPLRVAQGPLLLRPVAPSVSVIQLAAYQEAVSEGPPPADANPAQPAPPATTSPAPVQAVDELTAVLESWTQTGRNIRSLHARVRRYQYDTISQIETRAHGRLYFEAPHQGLLALEPMPVTAADKSTRVRADGRPYDLITCKHETLYWAQGTLTKINPARLEFERFAVPQQFLQEGTVRTVGSWDVIWTMLGSPRRQLPGLIEVDAEVLANRFDWTILSRDEKQILLTGRTVEHEERRHYSSLQVVLDGRTFLTKAIKTVDSSGTRETVHIFEDVRINEPRRLDAASWAPDLREYFELSEPRPAPPPSPAEEEEFAAP